ncbi:MAG: NCS2 family permease, partial [Eubacterium sp.]
LIDFTTWSPQVAGAIVALIGLIIIGVLHAYKVKGYIFIGIIAGAIIGIPFGVTMLPTSIDFSSIGTQFQDWIQISVFNLDFSSLIEGGNLFGTILNVLMAVIAFSMVDMFDTLGTIIGTAQQANMLDEKGEFPQLKRALMADSLATTAGALMGSSTVTTYVESSVGILEGGRTGLTAMVTAILFLAALLFSPFISIISSVVTAPALLFVGLLMIQNVKNINFSDVTEALPAFVTLIFMPFTFSISDGIAFGLITYVLVKLFTKQFKDIQIVTVVLAVLFLMRYILL